MLSARVTFAFLSFCFALLLSLFDSDSSFLSRSPLIQTQRERERVWNDDTDAGIHIHRQRLSCLRENERENLSADAAGVAAD